jgi:hypothetical protein
VHPDAKDGKPIVAAPDIPMCWPTGAGFTEKAVYVCDTYNRRVVRADFTWKAEETCTIGGGPGASAPPAAPLVAAAPMKSDSSDRSEKSDRSDSPKAAGRSPEQVCTGWLSSARNYARIGMTADAQRCLNNVIRDYPGTDWAAQARQELAKL